MTTESDVSLQRHRAHTEKLTLLNHEVHEECEKWRVRAVLARSALHSRYRRVFWFIEKPFVLFVYFVVNLFFELLFVLCDSVVNHYQAGAQSHD